MKETSKLDKSVDTYRRDHLNSHPDTLQYSIYSDARKISPTWLKVSKTPWNARQKLLQGYGRRMVASSISEDAPTAFVNAERNPKAQTYKRKNIFEKTPSESSYVLPGGRDLLKVSNGNFKHHRHRTFPHKNETVIDVLLTERTPRSYPPIQWKALPPAGPKRDF